MNSKQEIQLSPRKNFLYDLTPHYEGTRFKSLKDYPPYINIKGTGRYRMKRLKHSGTWLSLPFIRPDKKGKNSVCFIKYTREVPTLYGSAHLHLLSNGVDKQQYDNERRPKWLYRQPEVWVFQEGLSVTQALKYVNEWASNTPTPATVIQRMNK